MKLSQSGRVEWSKTLGGDYFDEIFDIKASQSGGYALSGATLSGGVNSHDFVLLTLSSDFSYCGNLVFEEVTFIITDFTHHPDLIALDPDFQSAIDSISLTVHSVAITHSDLVPSLNTL